MCMSLKTSCTSMTPDVCIEMTFNTQNTSNPRLHGWNWPGVVDGWVAFQEAGIGPGCFLHSKLWEPSAGAEQRAKNGVVDIPEFENAVNVVSDSVIRSD